MVDEKEIWSILSAVTDPEVPVLTITDLGILRTIVFDKEVNFGKGSFEIYITPTYSGCPAMDVIRMNIRLALLEKGITNFNLHTVLSPAWTTDWITKRGRKNLLDYGIAPPMGLADKSILLGKSNTVPCPQCHSTNNAMISAFGSTACKALYKCLDCQEPFDYFKCH